MQKGYLSIVLHAHLPYVRHPEHERFLEEEWFYEAITETYIPLIKAFRALVRDGVDFRITMSLTPTLLSMMADPLLQSRYIRHVDRLIELSGREIERTRGGPFYNLAVMYHDKTARLRLGGLHVYVYMVQSHLYVSTNAPHQFSHQKPTKPSRFDGTEYCYR